MALPVSSYEELLARVRSLTTETIQLRQEVTLSLSDHSVLKEPSQVIRNICTSSCFTHPLSVSVEEKKVTTGGKTFSFTEMNSEKPRRPTSLLAKKESEFDREVKELDEKRSSPTTNAAFTNDWGPESLGLWHSGPSSLYSSQPSAINRMNQDITSVASYACEDPEIRPPDGFVSATRTYSHQQLGVKVEMVYNLLSMLDSNSREDMSKTFLAMSSSVESCHAMRQSGCLPLLVQLIYSPELDAEVQNRAVEALQNVVNAQTDEKRRRRELRVLKLLQQVREYCNVLNFTSVDKYTEDGGDRHPITAAGALMKFSFDAEHRQAICNLGGLHAIAELIQVDHKIHGIPSDNILCVTLRRYAGMSLTNLTFGDGKNKALLCGFGDFMRALVDQLKSPNEDLRQVTASVLRNLSWRADTESKKVLREVGTVPALMVAAMEVNKESTLKSVLSALWNLSAHCSMNKVDICSVPGALDFLVKMLKYKSASNTLAIVENAGGIIRNISSHVAVREDYRQILRNNNCFEILLEHLKSPSLTIVSNACGTLWNLSARCSEDQKRLWEMGAIGMLRSLIQSKHKMISMGSSAALKNLLTANPTGHIISHLDSTAKGLGLQTLPSLFVRKQRALEQELNISLAETCENIEPNGSPILNKRFECTSPDKPQPTPKRSDSRESVMSTQSDSIFERLNQIKIGNDNKMIECSNVTLHESLDEKQCLRKVEDRKLMERYKTSMIPMPTLRKISQDKLNERTKEEVTAEDNVNYSRLVGGTKSSLEENRDAKDTGKRGIPVLKARHRTKVMSAVDLGTEIDKTKFSTTELQVEFEGEKSLTTNLNDVHECSGLRLKLNEELENARILDFSSNDARQFSDTDLSRSEIKDKFFENTITSVFVTENEGSEEKIETTFGCEKNEKKTSSSQGIVFCSDSTESQCGNGTNFQCRPENVEESNCPEYQAVLVSNKNDSSQIRKTPSAENVSVSEKSDNVAVPDFKVGSEITDCKILEHEANKISHEFQKYQEVDMGWSLTSEVSLVSCSSFLDAADYSLFEVSSEIVDLEEEEEDSLSKKSSIKAKNFPFRKTFYSNSGEPVSLPSLGSLKNEQVDTIDLDSSIISVASITSEIAETYTKDKDCFHTSVKTDGTLTRDFSVANGEDLDEDNSLYCQENLPLDSDNCKEQNTNQRSRKLTPKEKRRTFHDRYRTYTIRDLKGELVSKRKETDENFSPKPIVKEKSTTESELMSKTFICKTSSDHFHSEDNQFESINCANLKEPTAKSEQTELATFPAVVFAEEDFDLVKVSRSFDGGSIHSQAATSDSKSLSDLLDFGPAERKELADNAKLVAISLKTAIRELELDVVTDSEPEESTTDNTLTSEQENDVERTRELKTAIGTDSSSENQAKTGPKILKSDGISEERKKMYLEKVIRGKRKPLYVAPFRQLSLGNSATPVSPKVTIKPAASKNFSLATAKSLPNVSKSSLKSSESPTLCREGTFTKEPAVLKRPCAKNAKTIPTLTKNTDLKNLFPHPAVRSKSGSFLRNTRRSTEILKLAKPTSSNASENSDKATEVNPNLKKQISFEGGTKTSGKNFKMSKSHAPQGIENSSGNQSSKAGCSTKCVSSVKSKNSYSQGLKSTNNASANLVAGKQTTPKKEITSKIACLWKKIEETKSKSQSEKDTRVWIVPDKIEKMCVEKEEILEIPTQKIVHSFTCQDLTN